MFKAFKDADKKPKLEVTDNAFKLILPNLNYSQSIEIVNEKERNNQDIIVKYIDQHEFITHNQVEQLLKVSLATSSRILKQLVQAGI